MTSTMEVGHAGWTGVTSKHVGYTHIWRSKPKRVCGVGGGGAGETDRQGTRASLLGLVKTEHTQTSTCEVATGRRHNNSQQESIST